MSLLVDPVVMEIVQHVILTIVFAKPVRLECPTLTTSYIMANATIAPTLIANHAVHIINADSVSPHTYHHLLIIYAYYAPNPIA